MPNWVREVIPNIPRFGVVFALFPVCFKVFAWVEDRLSINAKEEISVWLKSTGNFATSQILSFILSRFHSQLFGDKQFSVKCLMRTMLFSFISYIMVFSPLVVVLVTFLFNNRNTKLLFAIAGQAKVPVLSDWTACLSGIILLLLIFTFVVLPLDFIGIGVTRTLAARAKNDIGLKNGLLIFIIDTLAKTIIFPIICIIFAVVIFVALMLFVIAIMKLLIKRRHTCTHYVFLLILLYLTLITSS